MRRGNAARLLKRGRTHDLTFTTADGIAWLRLERSEAGNRITHDLAQALCDAAAAIELDETVAAVVLTASGASFCVGVEAGGDWELRTDWVDAVARLTRPVIIALQGDAFAEGLELALAADIRIASDRARFAMPQLAVGRLPMHGGTQRLPRAVGRAWAMDMLLTGRSVGAAEAEAMGLISRVSPHHKLAQTLDAVVEQMKTKGPIALRFAKEAVLKGGDLTLDQGIRLEEDLYALLQSTHDRHEGIEAFLHKRKPMFRGK